MKNQQHFPALAYYFNAYLNQDFDIIFGDAEHALSAYQSTESDDEQHTLKHEIKSLLESSLDENQLRILLLDDMDCNYFYPADELTAREWLGHLLNRLDEPSITKT